MERAVGWEFAEDVNPAETKAKVIESIDGMAWMNIGLFHIPEDHLGFVSAHGVNPVQIDTWRKKRMRQGALKTLITAADGSDWTGSKLRSHYAAHSLPSQTECQNAQHPLVPYFARFFHWAFERYRQDYKGVGAKSRIVVNLFPFTCPQSVVDKVLRGLRSAYEELGSMFMKGRPSIVFLTRDASAFERSKFYKDTVGSDKYNLRLVVVDQRGFAIEGKRSLRSRIDHALISNVVPLDKKAFYLKLIYKTNAFIGHFVLQHSHIRTHYDLTDFVREDDVFEHIAEEFNHLLADCSSAAVVYSGMETLALERLTLMLARRFEQIEVLSENALSKKEDFGAAEKVIVLTDIVNSGQTLMRVRDKVRRIKLKDDGLLCYALIDMLNTPRGEDLPHGVAATIQRKYYGCGHGECPLCDVGQPKTVVRDVSRFSEPKTDLTPLDFWEMVYDCRALEHHQADESGRVMNFRVETEKIVKRYGNWLRNLISAKYDRYLKINPTRIITVHEKGGIAFARLVQRALELGFDSVSAVRREELHKYSSPALRFRGPKLQTNESVLLVDDGINVGRTLRLLAKYSYRQGADILGAFVFDNRLTDREKQRLRTDLSGVPILDLYSWPCRVEDGARENE